MRYIELIGPSGAGKTTLRRGLVDRLSRAIGGRDARDRCLVRTLPGGRLVARFPRGVRSAVCNHTWRHLYHPRYTREFVATHPESLECIGAAIAHVDRRDVSWWLLDAVARYALYSTAGKPHERIFVDDALYQYHLRLLVDDVCDADRLVSVLPAPDVLIAVDADPALCLERQDRRSRGRPPLFEDIERERALERLERWRYATRSIADAAAQRGITVVRVDSDGTPDELVARVGRELSG